MSAPTTERVACPKCHGTFKNDKSCRSHWDKTHRAEHGTFLGGRVEQVASLPDLEPIHLVQRVTSIGAPVDQLNILHLTPASFVGVPLSRDGLLMFQKLYCAFTWATVAAFKQFMHRNFGVTKMLPPSLRQFPGQHGSGQWAVTLVEGLQILSTTRCENGRILREEMANITARVASGDPDIVTAIFERMRTLDPAFRAFLMKGMHQSPEAAEELREGKERLALSLEQNNGTSDLAGALAEAERRCTSLSGELARLTLSANALRFERDAFEDEKNALQVVNQTLRDDKNHIVRYANSLIVLAEAREEQFKVAAAGREEAEHRAEELGVRCALAIDALRQQGWLESRPARYAALQGPVSRARNGKEDKIVRLLNLDLFQQIAYNLVAMHCDCCASRDQVMGVVRKTFAIPELDEALETAPPVTLRNRVALNAKIWSAFKAKEGLEISTHASLGMMHDIAHRYNCAVEEIQSFPSWLLVAAEKELAFLFGVSEAKRVERVRAPDAVLPALAVSDQPPQ